MIGIDCLFIMRHVCQEEALPALATIRARGLALRGLAPVSYETSSISCIGPHSF